MAELDLNPLRVLDVLLEERSVTRASERLGISPPSVSRMLARLRLTTGNPLLVRAGRALVPTARAEELQRDVRQLVENAALLLRPARLDLAHLDRRFTIRANDGFIAAFAAPLAARIAQEAPKVILRFSPEGESDDDAMREGRIDLDIGALRAMGPEVRVQTILRDRHVGLVRKGHPILDGEITSGRLCAFDHIGISRRGRAHGPIDDALGKLGLQRHVTLIVPFFQSGVAALPAGDMIAMVPRHVLPVTGPAVSAFDLPVTLEPIVIAQAWHPRFDRDPAHQFLRHAVRTMCATSVDPDA